MKTQGTTYLSCWCDSNWAAYHNTGGLQLVIRYNLVKHWSDENQTSSAEAEYKSIASVVAELTWLEGLFSNLGLFINKPITV